MHNISGSKNIMSKVHFSERDFSAYMLNTLTIITMISTTGEQLDVVE